MMGCGKRVILTLVLVLLAASLQGCAFVGVIIEAIAGIAGGAAGGAVAEGIGGAAGSQLGGVVGSAVTGAVIDKGTELVAEQSQSSGTGTVEHTAVGDGDEN